MVHLQIAKFKLFYRETFMGTISNVSTDWPWFIGDIEVTEAFAPFREGFNFLNDEDNESRFDEEPPIDLDNWTIEDEDGERKEVLLSVHEDNEIWWRW